MALNRTYWDTILLSVQVVDRLETLQANGTLQTVFPEVQALVGFGGLDEGHKALWDHTKRVVSQCVPQLSVRWAALFHDVGKPQAFRRVDGKICFYHHEAVSAKLFKQAAQRTGWFNTEFTHKITFIIRHVGLVEAYESSWTDSAVRRLARDLGAYKNETLALARADSTTGNSAKHHQHMTRTAELMVRMQAIQAIDVIPQALPKGLGDALMAKLGLVPGPELGRVMASLKARVETGELPRNAAIEVYLAQV